MAVPNIEKTLNPNELFLFKDLISPHFNPNWHFHPELHIGPASLFCLLILTVPKNRTKFTNPGY